MNQPGHGNCRARASVSQWVEGETCVELLSASLAVIGCAGDPDGVLSSVRVHPALLLDFTLRGQLITALCLAERENCHRKLVRSARALRGCA